LDNTNKVVSSESEELILVDADDNEIGNMTKAACHDGVGRLHRAFSMFLFNDGGELLLQQRSESKRLWPGYWSNSCCSHPRRNESMEVATPRRLRDELNVAAELEFIYRFTYRAEFGELGSEHESCHVYLGRIDGVVRPNAQEISAHRFVSAAMLDDEFEARPDQFTPWFKMEWRALQFEYQDALKRYCDLQREA
jgi:isopentenyl-diphosphate delta-isomerase